MTHPIGNVRLKAARQHAGYASQQALADALTRTAPQIGLGHLEISARQIRRWESATPPWPRADHQRLLVHVLQLPDRGAGLHAAVGCFPGRSRRRERRRAHAATQKQRADRAAVVQGQRRDPALHGRGDYAAITAAYRRLYTNVLPTHLHPAVIEHTRWARICSVRLPGPAIPSWPPPWPKRCCWPGGSSSSTSASPTTPRPRSSARCKQPVKPTTHCSAQRSSRTRPSSPDGSAAGTRQPTGYAPPAPTPGAPRLSRIPGLARRGGSRMRDDQRPHP